MFQSAFHSGFQEIQQVKFYLSKMFKKPFKVKSNTQIKSSDKKNLKELLVKKFPSLTEANIEEILPKKEVAFVSKVLTFSNKHVFVYTVQKRVVFFSVDDLYYPSVYLSWKYPDIGRKFTTNEFVLTKIAQGADLMLPGVFNNPLDVGPFLCKEVAVINTLENGAAAAIGAISMSSMEMSKTQVGKCVIVYHFYGDKLCSMEDMPLLSFPQIEMREPEEETNGELTLNGLEISTTVEIQDSESSEEILDVEQEQATQSTQDGDNMDTLLENAFLTACKYSKTLELPILTSSFYKLQMLPVNSDLDVKKSSYKKLGQFLKAMEQLGVISIAEKKKGVETIDRINNENAKLQNFYIQIDQRPRKQETEEEETKRDIVESYAVSQAVLPFFKELGMNKSDTLTTTEIRKHLTTYVKVRALQDPDRQRFILISKDPILSQIVQNEVAVTFDDLCSIFITQMRSCFRISTADTPTAGFSKGKLPPIIMTTHTRSGNKKVTLVDNLELYRIPLAEFSKECKRGVAASTSVSRSAGQKTDQILIQGNQVLFVYNLLIDKYKIPKKYIRGLENAPKSKKK